jgi:hypothetical protein
VIIVNVLLKLVDCHALQEFSDKVRLDIGRCELKSLGIKLDFFIIGLGITDFCDDSKLPWKTNEFIIY